MDIKLPSYLFMLVISFLLVLLFGLLFWLADPIAESKQSILYGGLFSAFSVALLQLLTAIFEAKKLKKYESFGVEDILDARRDHQYYEKAILKSKSEILVMGVTASRFMEDFANEGSSQTTALLQILSKGIRVKILVPKSYHLTEKEKNKVSDITIHRVNEVAKQYGNSIELRFFDSQPKQSMVITSDVCLVGPVFSFMESQHTPTQVFRRHSALARSFVEYFEDEWGKSNEEW